MGDLVVVVVVSVDGNFVLVFCLFSVFRQIQKKCNAI